MGLFTLDQLTRGLSWFPRSRSTSKYFVKFSMCIYERAGWLCSRHLSFSNRDLGKRAGNFAIWTLQPTLGTRTGFFSRATKSFVRRRSFTRAAKPWQKPETECEKPLAPRVTSAQLQGCKLDEFWRSGWHCLALPSYFPHHKLHHNCSDTALRVAETMIDAKVVCCVSRIWHPDSSPGSLAFPYLGNRAEISHMNPRQNSSR